ncbi:MAG: ECF-type sigma factor [Bryobacteraceae bacterium]
MRKDNEITRLIQEWQKGSRPAERALFEALYEALHNIALQCLRREKADRTIGATALIHEAYIRFSVAHHLNIVNRQHFLALSARVMRRILVDKARTRKSDKRGGEAVRIELSDILMRTEEDADELIAVDRALKALALQSPRQGQLVELRYFGGYTLEECSEVLGISARTARREWQVARTRLRGAIDGAAAAG